jgi:hypothetical protein
MNRYFLLSLVCLAVSTIPFTCGFPAQKSRVTVLFKHRNLPQAGDSIIKQQVVYVDPGAAGQDITWDFSTVQPVNDSYNVRYQALSPDTSVIGGIEHRTLYRYGVQGDTWTPTWPTMLWQKKKRGKETEEFAFDANPSISNESKTKEFH